MPNSKAYFEIKECVFIEVGTFAFKWETLNLQIFEWGTTGQTCCPRRACFQWGLLADNLKGWRHAGSSQTWVFAGVRLWSGLSLQHPSLAADLPFGQQDLLLIARDGLLHRLQDVVGGRGQPLVNEHSEQLDAGHDREPEEPETWKQELSVFRHWFLKRKQQHNVLKDYCQDGAYVRLTGRISVSWASFQNKSFKLIAVEIIA